MNEDGNAGDVSPRPAETETKESVRRLAGDDATLSREERNARSTTPSARYIRVENAARYRPTDVRDATTRRTRLSCRGLWAG